MVGDQCHYTICHALLERKGLKKHIHSGKWNKNLKIAPPTVRDFSQMFIIRDKEKPLRFSVSCLVLFWGLGKENCKIIQNTCSQYIQCPVNKHLRFDLTESLKSISRLIWFFSILKRNLVMSLEVLTRHFNLFDVQISINMLLISSHSLHLHMY